MVVIVVDEDSVDQETAYAEQEEMDQRRQMMAIAMNDLNDREKDILTKRRLAEPPSTLEDLSKVYNISRERVRQIEVRAFEKLQQAMQKAATEQLAAIEQHS